MPVLKALRARGVRVVVNTKPYEEHDQSIYEQSVSVIAALQNIGVTVLMTVGHHRKHADYVTERTVKDSPKPRERSWRYTHARLRSAYRQLSKQAEDLLRYSYRTHPELPATTNHLEGRINSPIRTKLKLHRGMKNEHQMVLVNWYLYSRTEVPKAPRYCL